MVFFQLFIKNKNLIKVRLVLLKIYKNASESTYLVTGHHGHDGPSWPLSSDILQILLLLSSLLSTKRNDRLFQERRSFEGLCSITLKLLGIWVLGLLSNHHDETAGWTFVSMMVRHEIRNPIVRSDFPIFLQQLHYDAIYAPSQDRRTITSAIGGNFSLFLAQKLPRSS